MAKSGKITGSCKNQSGASASSRYSTWIDWVVNSTNTTSNLSNITVYVRVQRIDGYTGETAWNKTNKPGVTLKVGGLSKTPTISYIDTRNQVVCTFATWTGDVIHNADGSLSLPISCSWTLKGVSSLGSGSISGNAALDTIPRASQPSCVTYPEHTQNVGQFGDTISIYMNRKSADFTHTVRYAFGSLSGTCINADTGKAATGVETGFKWKIPESFMDLLPAATSGSGTIYVDTYNGSTKIGTKSCGFTATVPASVKPRCTIQVLDDTDIQDRYGSLVKGLSKLYVKTNFYAAYSSPVSAYNVTANGVKYSTAEVVTGVLTKSGTTTVTATVTDKRGITSATASASFPVLDYSPPKITALAVHRCNVDGTANDRGEYVEVLFSGEVSPINNKNTATYTVKYKKTSDDSWTTLTEDVNGWKPADLNNNYNVNNFALIFAADGSSSYDVEVSVADDHGTDSRPTSASTAFTLINYHQEGNSIAFGGVSEEKNTFQNNLNFVQRGNQYCFSSIGAASTDGYILMARITVTAENADTPITFVFSRRKAVAPMTVHILFNSTANTDPGLASIRYEGDNYDAYLTSPTESVWDLYVKKDNASDTITLNRWHTSYRQMKRVNVEFVGSIESTVPLGRFGYYHAIPAVLRSIINCLLPVGMIIQLYSHADPNDMYPGTTWVRLTNTFLWGCDANGDIGITGGEKTHTLTVNELPEHTHGSVYSGNVDATKTHAWLASGGSAMAYGTIETGGGAAHNNMPPYTQVSIWRRTA